MLIEQKKKLEHANERYQKAYDKIVDTKPSDAIDN
jgi:hypothetical protein